MWEDSEKDCGSEGKANFLGSFAVCAFPSPDDKVNAGIIENGRGNPPFVVDGADGGDVALGRVRFGCPHDDGCPVGEGLNGGRESCVSMFSAERFIGVADLGSAVAS